MATTTTKPNIQIDDEVREMTSEEHTAYKAQQKANATAQAEAEAKIATRQSALAKLAALGLTAEEVASL
jgi:DNA-binding NarL/FixJ family response regulator